MRTVIIGMFLLLCLATFKLIVEEKKSKTKDEIITLLKHQIKSRDEVIQGYDSLIYQCIEANKRLDSIRDVRFNKILDDMCK